MEEIKAELKDKIRNNHRITFLPSVPGGCNKKSTTKVNSKKGDGTQREKMPWKQLYHLYERSDDQQQQMKLPVKNHNNSSRASKTKQE